MSEVRISALEPGAYGVEITEGHERSGHRLLVRQAIIENSSGLPRPAARNRSCARPSDSCSTASLPPSSHPSSPSTTWPTGSPTSAKSFAPASPEHRWVSLASTAGGCSTGMEASGL